MFSPPLYQSPLVSFWSSHLQQSTGILIRNTLLLLGCKGQFHQHWIVLQPRYLLEEDARGGCGCVCFLPSSESCQQGEGGTSHPHLTVGKFFKVLCPSPPRHSLRQLKSWPEGATHFPPSLPFPCLQPFLLPPPVPWDQPVSANTCSSSSGVHGLSPITLLAA